MLKRIVEILFAMTANTSFNMERTINVEAVSRVITRGNDQGLQKDSWTAFERARKETYLNEGIFLPKGKGVSKQSFGKMSTKR